MAIRFPLTCSPPHRGGERPYGQVSEMKKTSKLLYPAALLLTVLLAGLLSARSRQLLLIHGDSMSPSYRSGSLVWLDKRAAEWARGDVVLFRCEGLGRSLVKRIAAQPGDELCLEEDGLYINGERAAPAPPEQGRAACLGTEPTRVPAGYYFLLGDNLEESVDSRDARVGLVPEAALLGRVMG